VNVKLASSNVLLIGIDVGHSAKEISQKVERRRESYLGMVAMYVSEGQWSTYWDYAILGAGVEIIGQPKKGASIRTEKQEGVRVEKARESDVGMDLLKDFVKGFMKEHRPSRVDYVFVFRDGVSDHQLTPCRQYEVEQVISAFKETSTGVLPKIAYMVIQKTGLNKFFARSRDGGDIGSPGPGTVFASDSLTCTTPQFKAVSGDKPWKDFHLVTTYNSTSTAKPLHCFVIFDTTQLDEDSRSLQQLTFNLCHIYPNFCSSTRVPCVTRAAHKVAELMGRVGKSCGAVRVHPNLKKTYWYL